MRCRACDGPLVVAVDLGQQPSEGRFVRAGDPADVRLPLRLGACSSCGLAQLVDPSPPEADEPGAPSPLSSETMSRHARAFVDELAERGLATDSARILTLASHGGHLAPFLAERGLSPTVLEAVPTRAADLTAGGMQVVAAELDGDAGPGLAPASMDLIVDSYLLAHLPRPRLALQRLVDALAPGGVLVLEFDHLLATVEGGQWDAVRHGHQSYLALGWIADELARAGVAVIDAVPQPVYGGALRVFATAGGTAGSRVSEITARERAAGIDRAQGLDPLREAIERARRDVVGHLSGVQAAGRLVVGYGAPARAITFLNAVGVGPALLPYVVDRSPAKQDRMIPGVRIPIRSPDALAQDSPDEMLILTWDLADEVVRSIRPLVGDGTRFLVAIPRLVDVGAPDPG
jgi:SAM-dependent methyltransferase